MGGNAVKDFATNEATGQMQSSLQDAQAEIAQLEVQGESGAGMVSAHERAVRS